MGDPARKKSFDEEFDDASSRAFDAEWESANAPAAAPAETAPSAAPAPAAAPEPGILERLLGSPDDALAQNNAAWERFAEHPIRSLAANTFSPLLGAVAPFSGSGPITRVAAAAANGGIGAGAQRAAENYAEDPDAGVLSALVNAKDTALAGLGLGGGSSALGELGHGIANGLRGFSDRMRGLSYGGTEQNLEKLRNAGTDLAPEDIAAITDRLGLNNSFVPRGRAGKLDALDTSMARTGAAEDAAVRAADAQGVGQYRDWGGEVARDMYHNADNVMRGGSPNREGIQNAIVKGAEAAADHPMDSLLDLRRYKTNRGEGAYQGALRGTNESFSGKADLAAFDSARQHLEGAMDQAGPELSNAYRQNAGDYHDAALLKDLVQANRPGASTGSIAMDLGSAGLGSAVGSALGGPFGGAMGAGAGYAARKVAQNYGPDFAANTSRLASGGLASMAGIPQGASEYAGPIAGGVGADDQRRQLAGDSRGHLAAQATEMLLQRNPEVLGPYADRLAQAEQDGTLNAVLTKLVLSDTQFRTQYLPTIQRLTTESDNAPR